MAFDDDAFGARRRRATGAGMDGGLSSVNTTPIAPPMPGPVTPDPEPTSYVPPSGNTGVSGLGGGQPVPPVQRPQGASLMEGDPSKLGNAAHMAKSPKYQFLSLAQQYGRGQENDLLADLQRQFGAHWNGWNFDGRGNFNYGGDPSQLHQDWKGVTSVDAYGGYNGGGPLQARWGVNEPAANSGGNSAGNAALLSILAGMLGGGSSQSPASIMNPPAVPQTWQDAAVSAAPKISGAQSGQPGPTPMVLNPGGISQAMQMMAMQMPQLFAGQNTTDPLVQQLMALIGRRA